MGAGTIISCNSPKPKRDSLILIHERHSGIFHWSNIESKHVEFIRQPGDTVTPALHIGRAIQLVRVNDLLQTYSIFFYLPIEKSTDQNKFSVDF